MALYTLGDLHLSTGVSKPMDVFGGAWKGYMEKLEAGMQILTPDDTLVIPGDFSWGLSLAETLPDFRWLERWPGNKILVKGNHDLWWDTRSKMEKFFAANEIRTIDFLHNNFFPYESASGEKIALCGTRGWFFEVDHGTEHDTKMRLREVLRLKASLNAAKSAGYEKIYCFMHYPPVFGSYVCENIVDTLSEYGVERCYYGHLHGISHKFAVTGVKNGINYVLAASDSVEFQPIFVES